MAGKEKPKKGNNGLMKILAIGCLVSVLLFLCSFCGFIGITFIGVNTAVDFAKKDIVDLTCDVDNQDIASVYRNHTTVDFRSETSLAEFKLMMEMIDENICDEMEDINAWEVLINGWDISYRSINGVETINLSAVINSTHIILLLKEVGSDMKIDYMNVKQFGAV